MVPSIGTGPPSFYNAEYNGQFFPKIYDSDGESHFRGGRNSICCLHVQIPGIKILIPKLYLLCKHFPLPGCSGFGDY